MHIGHRDDDTAGEARERLGLVVSAAEAMALPMTPERLAENVRTVAGAGYWLQVDVDVLDPGVMPAVDSPDASGLAVDGLTEILRRLAPHAIGASVTVFDPDLDPDGRYARVVADVVVGGLAGLGVLGAQGGG